MPRATAVNTLQVQHCPAAALGQSWELPIQRVVEENILALNQATSHHQQVRRTSSRISPQDLVLSPQ
jgi:hypothetical protein